jgi:hypothetical protein
VRGCGWPFHRPRSQEHRHPSALLRTSECLCHSNLLTPRKSVSPCEGPLGLFSATYARNCFAWGVTLRAQVDDRSVAGDLTRARSTRKTPAGCWRYAIQLSKSSRALASSAGTHARPTSKLEKTPTYVNLFFEFLQWNCGNRTTSELTTRPGFKAFL